MGVESGRETKTEMTSAIHLVMGRQMFALKTTGLSSEKCPQTQLQLRSQCTDLEDTQAQSEPLAGPCCGHDLHQRPRMPLLMQRTLAPLNMTQPHLFCLGNRDWFQHT